ncbi:MAG: hypothetical protein OHK0015_48890 [Chloroflexi bacterium OHK40]
MACHPCAGPQHTVALRGTEHELTRHLRFTPAPPASARLRPSGPHMATGRASQYNSGIQAGGKQMRARSDP